MNKNSEQLIPDLRFPEFVNGAGWNIKELRKIGKTISGLTGKSGDDFGSGKPYVTYKQVFGNSSVNFSECLLVNIGDDENQNVIQKGDVLFTTSSETPDEVAFASVVIEEPKEPTYLNSFCFIYRPEDLNNIDPEFSRYLFRSKIFRELVGVLGQGSTRFNISKSAFLDIILPFPNPKEQQKIASCLSSLDAVITAQKEKLELLKNHKKGLMQNLFPQEGETVPKFRFPEFENDGDWEEKKLGDITENVMYGMNASAIRYDGENKYIRITDIDENSRTFLQNSLTSPNGQLEEKYILKIGDLLFARTGASVGKSYLHQKENGKIYFAGFLIRLTIKNEIPYFIYAQTLTDQYFKWVIKTSMRSGQPGLNAEEYKSYRVFIPPSINEQEKIVSGLSSLDELISSEKERLEKLQLHKKGLMQGLFPKMID